MALIEWHKHSVTHIWLFEIGVVRLVLKRVVTTDKIFTSQTYSNLSFEAFSMNCFVEFLLNKILPGCCPFYLTCCRRSKGRTKLIEK